MKNQPQTRAAQLYFILYDGIYFKWYNLKSIYNF